MLWPGVTNISAIGIVCYFFVKKAACPARYAPLMAFPFPLKPPLILPSHSIIIYTGEPYTNELKNFNIRNYRQKVNNRNK